MRILIASHGKLASGFKSSLSILVGSADQVAFIDAYIDERNFEDDLKAYFQTVDADEQVIMMSDMLGGSVNAVMYRYLDRANTHLITGINLPVVLELAVRSEGVSEEELAQIVENARKVFQMVTVDEASDDDAEEDFF